MRIGRSRLLRCLLGGLPALLLALGCGDGSDGAVSVVVNDGSLSVVVVSDCPRCNDPSSVNAFGRFAFSSNVSRTTARQILAVCGFAVSRGHAGLDGDNLQISGCGGGVELAFVSSSLGAYAVRDGYTGLFEGRIRIGDPVADVLAADPGLVQVDSRTLLRDDGTIRIEAHLDESLRLEELIVGRGFLR